MTIVVTLDRKEVASIFEHYIAVNFNREIKGIDISSYSKDAIVTIELGNKLPPERGGPGDL